MLSNEDWWLALDRLAHAHGLTASALARQAGLDATSFNRSKRRAPDGRPRWPSTESISKVLAATGTSIEDFIAGAGRPQRLELPLHSLDDIRQQSRLDTAGAARADQTVSIPGAGDTPGAFALKVEAGSVLAPAYGPGTTLLLVPVSDPKPPRRVLVLLSSGDLLAGTLARALPGRVEITPFGSDAPLRFTRNAIRSMAAIEWASQ